MVGTPGRILALVRDKTLNTKHLKHFVLDECDKMLDQLGKLQEMLGGVLYLELSPFFRHAQGCAGSFQSHASREAGHDVQCYSPQGDSPSLQEIHE